MGLAPAVESKVSATVLDACAATIRNSLPSKVQQWLASGNFSLFYCAFCMICEDHIKKHFIHIKSIFECAECQESLSGHFFVIAHVRFFVLSFDSRSRRARSESVFFLGGFFWGAKYDGPLYAVRKPGTDITLEVGLLTPGGFANVLAQRAFCHGTAGCEIFRIFDQSGYKIKSSPRLYVISLGFFILKLPLSEGSAAGLVLQGPIISFVAAEMSSAILHKSIPELMERRGDGGDCRYGNHLGVPNAPGHYPTRPLTGVSSPNDTFWRPFCFPMRVV